MNRQVYRTKAGVLIVPSGVSGESLTNQINKKNMAVSKAASKGGAKTSKGSKSATPKKADTKVVEKGPGKIEQIIALHKKGKSNAEIVEAGFNKTTVSIQVSKYKKEHGKK